MAKQAELEKLTGLASRFGAFIAERHPFALGVALDAFEAATGGGEPNGEAAIDSLRPVLRRELTRRLEKLPVPQGLGDATPRTPVDKRVEQARAALLEECDGFLR